MKYIALRRVALKSARRVLPDPTPYCIVTHGRTGSNLLCSLLRSHPKVHDAGEALGDWAFAHEGSTLRRDLLERGSTAYVTAMYRRQRLESASGIKVLYAQFEPEYAARQGVPDLVDLLTFLRRERAIRIIHLKRENRLETLVSMDVARDVREHRLVAGDGAAHGSTISLSPQRCVQEFTRIGEWEKRFDDAFRQHALLDVTYEALVADRDHESRRVQDFLGVPLRPLQTDLRKQIRRPMAQVIENYAELTAALAATPWARYFDPSG